MSKWRRYRQRARTAVFCDRPPTPESGPISPIFVSGINHEAKTITFNAADAAVQLVEAINAPPLPRSRRPMFIPTPRLDGRRTR